MIGSRYFSFFLVNIVLFIIIAGEDGIDIDDIPLFRWFVELNKIFLWLRMLLLTYKTEKTFSTHWT